MSLPIINREDLRRCLEDLIPDDTDLQDIRDARRCLANLTADDVATALGSALNNRALEIRAELD